MMLGVLTPSIACCVVWCSFVWNRDCVSVSSWLLLYSLWHWVFVC